MSTRTIALSVAILLGLWPTADAFAEDIVEPNGGLFFELCGSPNHAARQICGGVVISVLEAYLIIAEQKPESRVVCPPLRLEIDQARKVFIAWYQGHPEAARMAFPNVVAVALKGRYPCTEPPIRVR